MLIVADRHRELPRVAREITVNWRSVLLWTGFFSVMEGQ